MMERAPTQKAIFVAFLTISLCGVGGGAGIACARRILVASRRWVDDDEFGDIISLCQIMPGPNFVGIAICTGAKVRGTKGAVAALFGFLIVPFTVGLPLGALYFSYAHLTMARDILAGIATAAAGLLVAAG